MPLCVARILQIRRAVRDDVYGKIEKWGQVNYVWCAIHLLSGAPC